MRIKIISLLFVMTTMCHAQKEDYIWCMGWGDYAGTWEGTFLEEFVGNTFIDFREDPPLVYQDKDSHNQFRLANAQISTSDGDPLLYCNGIEVRTYLKDTLDGGGIIAHSPLWDELVIYVNGVRQTRGTNTSQSIVFVPLPGTDTKYLLFYNSFRTPFIDNELLYAEIDMSLNNGEGMMLYKDRVVKPNNDAQLSFYLRPVRHANGRDWWIFAPDLFQDKIYRILIDPQGIHYMGEQAFQKTGIGQAKYSPNGQYYAIADCITLFSPNNPDNTMHIYEVDRCSGELVEVYSDFLFDCQSISGIEFSPDNKYLYYTNTDEILQVDLTTDNLGESVSTIWKNTGQRDSVYFFNTPFSPRHMQLGPDKRIYVPSGGRGVVSVINKPWLKEDAVDYEDFAIIAPTPIFPATPNILNPRMGPVDGSQCDTLGIDNNPVSQFRYNQDDTLNHRTIGFVDLSYMEPTQWEWDFDDGSRSSEQYPVHTYDNNGIYNVCLTVSNDNSSDTFCKVIQLGTVSTEEEDIKPHVSIYPQPTHDYLRVAIHNYLPHRASLHIYDNQGHLVLESDLRATESTIDISEIPAGMYFYQIRDGQNLIDSDKLIKVE